MINNSLKPPEVPGKEMPLARHPLAPPPGAPISATLFANLPVPTERGPPPPPPPAQGQGAQPAKRKRNASPWDAAWQALPPLSVPGRSKALPRVYSVAHRRVLYEVQPMIYDVLQCKSTESRHSFLKELIAGVASPEVLVLNPTPPSKADKKRVPHPCVLATTAALRSLLSGNKRPSHLGVGNTQPFGKACQAVNAMVVEEGRETVDAALQRAQGMKPTETAMGESWRRAMAGPRRPAPRRGHAESDEEEADSDVDPDEEPPQLDSDDGADYGSEAEAQEREAADEEEVAAEAAAERRKSASGAAKKKRAPAYISPEDEAEIRKLIAESREEAKCLTATVEKTRAQIRALRSQHPDLFAPMLEAENAARSAKEAELGQSGKRKGAPSSAPSSGKSQRKSSAVDDADFVAEDEDDDEEETSEAEDDYDEPEYEDEGSDDDVLPIRQYKRKAPRTAKSKQAVMVPYPADQQARSGGQDANAAKSWVPLADLPPEYVSMVAPTALFEAATLQQPASSQGPQRGTAQDHTAQAPPPPAVQQPQQRVQVQGRGTTEEEYQLLMYQQQQQRFQAQQRVLLEQQQRAHAMLLEQQRQQAVIYEQQRQAQAYYAEQQQQQQASMYARIQAQQLQVQQQMQAQAQARAMQQQQQQQPPPPPQTQQQASVHAPVMPFQLPPNASLPGQPYPKYL